MMVIGCGSLGELDEGIDDDDEEVGESEEGCDCSMHDLPALQKVPQRSHCYFPLPAYV